ncbi:armadillo-type protein [Mycena amicta]|nr:armadillo-type protein [Mycena amicta]
MPQELRKRGKKKKAQQPEPLEDVRRTPPQQTLAPSWVIQPQEDPATLDPLPEDLKAYFRTVDLQLRDWQDTAPVDDDDGGANDPNEERRMFFVAALKEMGGKEKQLAMDPDCSIVLERMSYSMDDFVRRVFVDSLAGSYDVLAKDRFGSHVCQTFFTIASQTIAREQRGILPSIPNNEESGELRTLTLLIADVCEELLPAFTNMVIDPFGSHVMRALLLLLSPTLAAKQEVSRNAMRSKKSAKWKARQGPLKSVFDEPADTKDSVAYTAPAAFAEAARKFVQAVREGLDANETRALAANKVASPTLQILLAVEAEQQMTDEADSLMDRLLVGLVSASRKKSVKDIAASDFVTTLLRDPTSSHLLETIVAECPALAFSQLWTIYFQKTLSKIASHPVANFVLAKAFERLDASQLTAACGELQNSWGKMLQNSRTGVLRAAIDRASSLKACGPQVTEALWAAIQATTPEEKNLLVSCMLRLQTVQELKASIQEVEVVHNRKAESDEPKVQGAVLLQSLLRLPEPFNQLVIDSLTSFSIEEILSLARHPISSRVLDVLLESPTVPMKVKRQFVQSFIGHYHTLVDDRIGSRVGDRCWTFSDTYLKEKIARSLISQESFLAGSYYGKFFARNLNLYLLQRRPEEWRTMQASKNKPAPVSPKRNSLAEENAPNGNATRDGAKDEIDELFAGTLGKKVKKGALDGGGGRAELSVKLDSGLADVMGAIKAAPGERRSHRKGRS